MEDAKSGSSWVDAAIVAASQRTASLSVNRHWTRQVAWRFDPKTRFWSFSGNVISQSDRNFWKYWWKQFRKQRMKDPWMWIINKTLLSVRKNSGVAGAWPVRWLWTIERPNKTLPTYVSTLLFGVSLRTWCSFDQRGQNCAGNWGGRCWRLLKTIVDVCWNHLKVVSSEFSNN